MMRSTPPEMAAQKARSGGAALPSFHYNGRVFLAQIPCALLLLEMGGFPVMSALTIGLMVTYILDSVGLKQAAFFSVWATLTVSQLIFTFTSTLRHTFHSWPIYLLTLFLCSETTFLIGVWSSLQFKWMQIEHPSVAQMLERVLFACTPLVAACLCTYAAVAASGMDHAPYYLMCLLCLFYWLFSLPRTSSFTSDRKAQRDRDSILGPLESSLHTLSLVFMPLLFHIASHHSVLFSSAANVCDMFLLFFIPLLFQLYASSFGALWYISKDPDQLLQIRVVNGLIALVVIVACLEVRVVFHSFGRYVSLSPPWNYVAVTVTMLGGAVAASAYAVGLVSESVGQAVFTCVSVLVAVAASLVVGLPPLLFPAPIAAGYYIAHFFTKKTVSSYFIFVVAATIPIAWFVVHNYWNLNIWLAGISMKSFCKYMISTIVLAMVVPGLALLPANFGILTKIGLVSHALLLCYIENRLHVYASLFYFYYEDDVIYPSYMVIITSVLGFALIRRLYLDNRIGNMTVWLLTCLYAAKLSILFLTSRTVLWMSAILLLAVSPPLLLYKDKGKAASRMKPWQAFGHAAIIATSIWLCRSTIFEALQWWQGRPPSDSFLLGFIILISGVGCIPIVVIHFPHQQLAKRVLVLVVAVGVLVVFLQPPVPEIWNFQTKFIQTSQENMDDSTIYGLLDMKPTWPSWLLIITLVVSLAAFTKIIPVQYIVELRLLYAIVVGASFGIYLCAEFVNQAHILHILLVVVTVCASIFMVFTHLPSTSSPRFLPWIFATIIALLPVTYMVEGQLRLNPDTDGEEERFIALLALEGARSSLLGLFAAIFMLIALEIKIELSSMMREKAYEKGIAQTSDTRPGFVPKYRLLNQRRATAAAASSFTVKKLAAEGAWMPVAGNVSAILSFLICLALNVHMTGGSDRGIFIIAPILLLLNQDSTIFSGFGDRQRYFPLVSAISLYLVAAAVYRIWYDVLYGYSSWGLDTGGPGWFFAIRNMILLILTLPMHAVFNRFMWDYKTVPDLTLFTLMPLNLPSLLMTDLITIRVMALLGMLYALVQYWVSRRTRIKGLQFI